MKRKMKKLLLMVGLSMAIGTQSMGAAQAAVNYEACPMCGTRVTWDAVTRKVGLRFDSICTRDENCAIYIATYDIIYLRNCETPGCPTNSSIPQGREWEMEEHHTIQ